MNFQPILDCIIPHFRLKYEDSENIKANCVNTFVLTLRQIKRRAGVFLGHPVVDEQGWISDMGIDGPTFVPKSGYFLFIWVKVCPQKLAFS